MSPDQDKDKIKIFFSNKHNGDWTQIATLIIAIQMVQSYEWLKYVCLR